jgi:hypothetical protein
MNRSKFGGPGPLQPDDMGAGLTSTPAKERNTQVAMIPLKGLLKMPRKLGEDFKRKPTAAARSVADRQALRLGASAEWRQVPLGRNLQDGQIWHGPLNPMSVDDPGRKSYISVPPIRDVSPFDYAKSTKVNDATLPSSLNNSTTQNIGPSDMDLPEPKDSSSMPPAHAASSKRPFAEVDNLSGGAGAIGASAPSLVPVAKRPRSRAAQIGRGKGKAAVINADDDLPEQTMPPSKTTSAFNVGLDDEDNSTNSKVVEPTANTLSGFTLHKTSKTTSVVSITMTSTLSTSTISLPHDTLTVPVIPHLIAPAAATSRGLRTRAARSSVNSSQVEGDAPHVLSVTQARAKPVKPEEPRRSQRSRRVPVPLGQKEREEVLRQGTSKRTRGQQSG